MLMLVLVLVLVLVLHLNDLPTDCLQATHKKNPTTKLIAGFILPVRA